MQEAEKLLDGPLTVRQSGDTSTLFDGGSDKAGFVQVMEGTADRAKAEALETPEMLDGLRQARPDLLGGLRVWFDGGEYMEILPGTGLHRMTEALPPAQLTLFEPLANGVNWVSIAGVNEGDTVVIEGPGHQGLAVLNSDTPPDAAGLIAGHQDG